MSLKIKNSSLLHEEWGGKHLALTFTLCAAGHGVDRRDGPRETKPQSLQLALLPSGALLEDFDHSILLQELSVKCADPKHMEYTVRSQPPLGAGIKEYRGRGKMCTCSPSPDVYDSTKAGLR